MNFRKAKVSKAAWFVPLALGLLVPAPAPAPLMYLPAMPGPAPLAYATPPPLADGLSVDLPGERAPAAGGCANAAREPRFEMISVDSDPSPPTWRSQAVCLAVYIPSGR